MENNKLLITQSFIVDAPGSYWDYRDYIFSICSNPSLKNQPFRLNVERGGEWLPEFKDAAEKFGFTDFSITDMKPESWSSYMLEMIDKNPCTWTMPFPGDHIYINADQELLSRLLEKAETLGADAVAYGHVQDFDQLLDWDMIDVLYSDEDSVMINWGNKYKFFRNHSLIKKALNLIGQFIIVTPAPGFMIYRSPFFKKILEALPAGNKRWQDMEYSPAKDVDSYKILLPKKCLYRHVHGYWLEILNKGERIRTEVEKRTALDSMYIRSVYDWKNNTPAPARYREMTLEKFPYYAKYLNDSNKEDEKIFCGSAGRRGSFMKLIIKEFKLFRYPYFYGAANFFRGLFNRALSFKK